MFILGAVFAWTEQFSYFSDYDDEGYMMMAVRLFLDGELLYGNLKTPYGPFYFASRWFLFGLIRVPLTHDAVRTLTVITWLATAAAMAATISRVVATSWNKIWLAAACAAACIQHLDTLKQEPGHPQELIVFGIAVALLVATLVREHRMTASAIALGSISAALCLTKANVGVFLSVACLLTLAVHSPPGKIWKWLRWLISLAALALPCALLREKLNTEWSAFGFTATTGLLLCILAAFRFLRTSIAGRMVWTAYFGGGIAAALLLLGFVLICGGSLNGMLDCLLIGAARHTMKADFSFPFEPTAIVMMWVAILLAAWWHFTHGTRWGDWNDRTFAWFKMAAALFSFWATAMAPELLAQYGPAWIWLVLAIPACRKAPSSELFFRSFLAFVSVLQTLQMYPVPGSQMSVGSIALSPLAILLLADWAESIQAAYQVNRTWLLRLTCAALGFLPMASLIHLSVPSFQRYCSFEGLDLPGCQLTRLPGRRTAVYRWLAENARASDLYVSRTGLNSLYFWSECRPAGDGRIYGWCWALVPSDQQREMIEQCDNVGDVLAIDHPNVLEKLPWDEMPFGKYLSQQFQPLAQFDRYTLLQSMAISKKPPVGCAWYNPTELQQGSNFPDAGQTIELHLAIPTGLTSLNFGRAVVLDLSNQVVIADTALPDTSQRASFAGGQSCSCGLRLVIPNGHLLHGATLPVVRLFDDLGRRHTLAIPQYSQ